jgi:hypothetical protein
MNNINTRQANNGQWNVVLNINKFFDKKKEADIFAQELANAIESLGKIDVKKRFLLFEIN